MAIPAAALKFDRQMDPGDRLEYLVDFTPLLQTVASEQIDPENWSVTMSPEGAALGVTIPDAAPRLPFLDTNNTRVVFWLEVAAANRADAVFNAGVDVPITIRFDTTNTPPRTYERTVVVRVVNQ